MFPLADAAVTSMCHAARTEILVGVNQVIMLCLAMVVLTAFIGMPGLGAKLLATDEFASSSDARSRSASPLC